MLLFCHFFVTSRHSMLLHGHFFVTLRHSLLLLNHFFVTSRQNLSFFSDISSLLHGQIILNSRTFLRYFTISLLLLAISLLLLAISSLLFGYFCATSDIIVGENFIYFSHLFLSIIILQYDFNSLHLLHVYRHANNVSFDYQVFYNKIMIENLKSFPLYL